MTPDICTEAFLRLLPMASLHSLDENFEKLLGISQISLKYLCVLKCNSSEWNYHEKVSRRSRTLKLGVFIVVFSIRWHETTNSRFRNSIFGNLPDFNIQYKYCETTYLSRIKSCWLFQNISDFVQGIAKEATGANVVLSSRQSNGIHCWLRGRRTPFDFPNILPITRRNN